MFLQDMGGGDRIPGNSQASQHARWENKETLCSKQDGKCGPAPGVALRLFVSTAFTHTLYMRSQACECTHTHMHIHMHTQRSYSKYLEWNYFRGKAGLLSHVFQCPLPQTVSPAALPDEIPFVDQTQNWDPAYLFFRLSPVPLVSSWLPSIENWVCQPSTVVWV